MRLIDIDLLKDFLDNLPTTTAPYTSPRRPCGYWNEIQAGMYVCPFCGAARIDHRVGYTNFCNRCGADLRKEKKHETD